MQLNTAPTGIWQSAVATESYMFNFFCEMEDFFVLRKIFENVLFPCQIRNFC